jgi:hypothetical protein
MPKPDKLSVIVPRASPLSTFQISEKSIHLKHTPFDIIERSERDNRLKPEEDLKFWLVDETGEFLGNNPIKIGEELKISSSDASKLFRKKLNDLKNLHENFIKLIDRKLAHIESIYNDDKLICSEMRTEYLKGTNTQIFQDHIIRCRGCYNWFVKRVQSGDFHTQTILEEVKKTRQKRQRKKQEQNYKEWKKKQGEPKE